MNFQLPFMPQRPAKPRNEGLTMMMDKGISVKEAEEFVESSGEFTDYVKFGFGTSIITNRLNDKISVYRKGNIRPYFGGTMFEAFIVRNMFEDYRRFIDKYKIDLVEVSDGSMSLAHDKKLEYIHKLSQQATVLSEVGSKMRGVFIPADQWVQMMKTELESGATKVIAEARESGTIGIYNVDGSVNESLINTISKQISNADIIWEAPDGKQQVWFIKLFGPNVNLGNIAVNGVVPLECLRLGLRGDTFFDSLPSEFKEQKQTAFEHLPFFDFQI